MARPLQNVYLVAVEATPQLEKYQLDDCRPPDWQPLGKAGSVAVRCPGGTLRGGVGVGVEVESGDGSGFRLVASRLGAPASPAVNEKGVFPSGKTPFYVSSRNENLRVNLAHQSMSRHIP